MNLDQFKHFILSIEKTRLFASFLKIRFLAGFFTPIEFSKRRRTAESALLNKDLTFLRTGITAALSIRYEDRTKFSKLRELSEELENVQIIAKIRNC